MSATAVPTFAIVGAVNHGKSSVVSTLAENDQVRISSMPGETVTCQRFWLRDLFAFYDTPGFQNAIEALRELEPAARASEPLAVFRDFLQRRRGQPDFEAECRLLQPIIEEDAGIIYVVDGSEPLLEIHIAEMEILRLTGQPRLAIINRTKAEDHLAEWRRRLGLHFNAVREFNAHYASFSDRVELLETLAGIEQRWKPPLMAAVAIFREEWDKRLDDCAEIIFDLLDDALSHCETAPGSELSSRRNAIGEKLKAQFMRAVSEREAKAHKELILLFEHHRVKTGHAPDQLIDAELFSEETWRLFGLNEKQLVVAGAIGGAAAGALFDLATAGHSIGLPTVLGAAGGAVGTFLMGKKRPELKAKLPGSFPLAPGRDVQFGGRTMSVGPCRAVNFPWILLDRAIGVFCYLVNRTHARRDEATLGASQLKAVLEQHNASSSRWTDEKRRACERIFEAIRRNKFNSRQREALLVLIRERLSELRASPSNARG
ncbi:MAG TPA: GTPase/DUF3482 domain-containing protein [Terrimicrobiaceae bacterium]